MRRILGVGAVVVAFGAMAAGLWVVSQHHPGSFISREWRGFTSEPTDTATTNHFLEVGSGRYDIWRSAVKAFSAHPLGGLGQDNFGDWYLTHRHTIEEPLWTHSLELRLLASTGIVGFLLFAGFLNWRSLPRSRPNAVGPASTACLLAPLCSPSESG